MKNLKLILIILASSLLSACGFHLRGKTPLPPQLHAVYLQSVKPYGNFTRYIRQSLIASGAHMATSATAAPVIINITQDGLSKAATNANLSTGISNQVTTYLLTYRVSYNILSAKGVVILPMQNLSTITSYTLNANQVQGDNSAQQNLVFQMQQNLVTQMMTRLGSPNTAKALEHPHGK